VDRLADAEFSSVEKLRWQSAMESQHGRFSRCWK
jgi:hypothetical protein